MKKTLTILSLLSVLFLTACEESVVSELESKYSGYTEFSLSDSEKLKCSMHFSNVNGEIIVNGAPYFQLAPNVQRYDAFPVEMVEEFVSVDEIGRTYELTDNGESYDLQISDVEGPTANFAGIIIDEDEEGAFMDVDVNCAEGLIKLRYRLQ